MTSYEIIEATPAHIMALKERLRDDDRAELQCAGTTAAKALWRSYRASIVRRTVIVDEVVAAVGGCGGSVLAGIGEPWLLTAPEIERIPVSFVKEGRAEVAKLLGLFPRLENIVVARYARACRFLTVLGFQLDEARPMGPQGAMFRRFWMER